MGEIKTPLLRLEHGVTFRAGEDGAYVIDSHNTHSDILRYIVGDVGKGHAVALLNTLEEEIA